MTELREILKADKNSLSAMQMIKMVIRLSIPAIMAEISSIAMQYIDAAMVGSLGAHASAAIGLVSTTTWLIGGLCLSAATGFSVQTAQLIGGGRDEEARNTFRQSLIIAVLFGMLLSVISISISGRLPVWLGGAEELREDASKYFLIYSCVLVFAQIRQMAGSMLQCSGDMKTPSILNVILCGLDVVFNFIFIFPSRTVCLLGMDIKLIGAGMGVSGAALGTACAEAVISVSMLLFACFKSDKLAFHKGGSWHLRKECLKTALKLAIPAAIEHTIMCSAYVVSTLIVAPLGTIAVAANSLAVTAESFCYMPGYGISSAATTLVGQSMGAERRDIAKRFSHIAVLLGVCIMSCTAIAMFAFAPNIFGMLTPDAEVIALGTAVLRIEAFAEPLYAASIVCAGALRGAGDVVGPSVLNLISMWGVRITLASVLVPHMGLYGVWIAMCIELCVRGILFLVRLIKGKWLKKGIIV